MQPIIDIGDRAYGSTPAFVLRAPKEGRVHRQEERPKNPLRWIFTAALSLFVLCVLLPSFASWAQTASDNEGVPERAPSDLLPPELVAGSNFHVLAPVQGDGLMYHFVIASSFGEFKAYGHTALAIRVQELAALGELAKKSDVELVAGGVSRGIEGEVQTGVKVLTHPVSTVAGIPKGISNLFNGYAAKTQEALAEANKVGSSSAGGSRTAKSASTQVEAGAKKYAERYLGVTAAERGWYRRLRVDPYTDNTVLRAAIRRAARKEAIGSFGIKFAGIPAIPGMALTQRAVDAIYNEDPAALRARTRKTLAGYGLTSAEIDNWLNAPLLSPTRQVVLLSAAEQLDGVEDRAELFRHSLGLTSDEEAQVYLNSTSVLLRAHKTHPLQALLPNVRLPAGKLANGGLVVCGAFEAIYWTEAVARDEEQLRQSLETAGSGAARELWIIGSLSDLARNWLRERGWELHELAEETPTPR